MVNENTLRGKVYPQYHVTCGMCGDEKPLGTTKPEMVSYRLANGGYKLVKDYGYCCEKCREEKADGK